MKLLIFGFLIHYIEQLFVFVCILVYLGGSICSVPGLVRQFETAGWLSRWYDAPVDSWSVYEGENEYITFMCMCVHVN